MSSYWAAYHGQGLALTPEEFSVFLENYKTKWAGNKALEKIEDLEEGEIDLSDVNFITSAGQEFDMFCVDDGSAEGFRLIPYRVDGKPNDDWELTDFFPSNNVYVLSADKTIDGMACFDKKAYDSYAEFLDEFKGKLAEYLPEDFDWDAHIGIYSYACYA